MKNFKNLLMLAVIMTVSSCATKNLNDRKMTGTACAPMKTKDNKYICRRMNSFIDRTRFWDLKVWESYGEIPSLNEIK